MARGVDSLPRRLRASEGIARLDELRSAGIPDAEIRRALRNGAAIRVREAVIALPECDEEILQAARAGGRLAGASAARRLGFWSPPDPRLVVEAPRGSHARIGAPQLTIIRGPAGSRRFGCSAPEEVVAQALRSEPLPFAIAIIDSVVRGTGLTELGLHRAVGGLPLRLRRAVELVDGRAESGTESVVRTGLRLAGIPATPQARLPLTELGRMDLVVGDRLVIEYDSREFHSSPADLERDNARDLLLIGLGFLVVRVRYRSAMFDLDGVVAAIRRLTEEGLHLDGSAPGGRNTPDRARRVV